MSLPARLARTVLRWRSGIAAQRALSAAVYGDCAEGHRITARALGHGPAARRALAGAWCATFLAGVPRAERRSGVYWPDLSGAAGEVADADSVPWATALVAAHARRDWPLCRALVDCLLPREVESHLAVLLHAAADATVTREADRW